MKTTDTLIKKYNLPFGTYYFYTNYFIAEINEGEIISLEQIKALMPIVLELYGNGQPFTYISNRIHSHAINAIDYSNCPLIKLSNFIGYGVITYNEICKISIEVEKHFAKRPFYHFKNTDDALEWTHKELDNTNKLSS